VGGYLWEDVGGGGWTTASVLINEVVVAISVAVAVSIFPALPRHFSTSFPGQH